jgi:hypothetical protein
MYNYGRNFEFVVMQEGGSERASSLHQSFTFFSKKFVYGETQKRRANRATMTISGTIPENQDFLTFETVRASCVMNTQQEI